MKPKHTSRLVFPALILAGSLAAPFAQAASQSWDGGSVVDGNWSTVGNWVADPAAPGATIGTTNTDVATFNAAIANTWGNAVGNPVVIDSTTQNLGGISFGAATGNYFIGGNSLRLTSGGTIQILGSLTATNAIETINAPLDIQGANGTYTLANKSSNGAGAGAGTLNFGGAITGGAAGATVLNLGGANTNANTISGIIDNSAATTLAVTKSGSGLWKLTGANTYTGATTINAGTLTLNAATGSLSSASALTFTGSGTFNMDNVGASGALTQSLGALTFSSGDGTVKTTRTAAFDQALTFASLSARTAGASANFVNTGTNSATNGFVFTTAPTASALIDRSYFYNGSSYAAYDAGGFVRAYGAGDANFLTVGAGATMGAASTDNVALTGNITAQTTTTVNTINMGANNVTLSAAGQILSTNGLLSSGSTAATLGFAGTTAATTGVLQATAAGDEIVIRVNGSTDKLTVNAIIQNVGAGVTASSLTKTGAGTLVLNDNTGNNTYTGGTFLNAGTIQLGSANAGSGTRNWFGTGVLTIADGAGIMSVSDPEKTVNNAVTLSGGYANLTARDTHFTGKISGPGGVAVIPNSIGGRWLNLNNTASGVANDFTGGIVFRGTGQSNTLRVFTTTSLSTGGIRVEGTNNFIATEGRNLSIGAGVANAIELASGGSLEIASNSGPILLSGAITGGGSLSHNSASTLALSGVNSYAGGTTVKAGVLTVSGSGTFGASTGNLTAQGGTLDLAGNSFSAGTVNITGGKIQNGTLTGTSYAGTSGFVTANLAGTGALTMNGGGNRLVLSGNNTYNGGTTITAGTLRATGDYALPNYGSGTINVGANGTLQVTTGEWSNTEINALLANPNLLFTSGGTFAIDTTNGNFSNGTVIDIANLGLTKLGANTLTLTGANSYTKTTTVNRGTLKIDAGAGATLSASSPLTFSGTGAFNYDNTNATGAKAQSLSTLTFSAGEGTVQVTRTVAQNVGLTFSSLAARTAGATRNFVLDGATPGTNNGTEHSINLTGQAAGFIDQGSFFGGNAYAYMDAAGTFVRGGVYGSDTDFVTSGATATLAPATHQEITGAITAQNTSNFTTLKISGNHDVTLAAAQTVSVNGILKSGNTLGGATITGGTGIQAISSGGEMVVRTDGANDALTLSTPVLGNGTSSLTKSGAGTLTLSVANTITAISNTIVNGVTLNAGTLNINNATALGGPMTAGGGNSNARFTINEGTTIDTTAGPLTLALKYPMTLNGSFAFTGTNDLNFFDTSGNGNLTMPNDVTITVAAKTLNIPHNFNATSAGLTKNGPGTLAIGTNGGAGYSGGLTINNGVLTSTSAQPDGIAGTGPVTLGSATVGSDNAILSSGGNTTHSNPITVRAGSTGIIALTAYNNTATWAGPVTLNNNLTVGGAGSVTLTSVISGSGGLLIGNAGTYITGATTRALTNTGTVTLIGNNTFTGDTVMVTTSNGSLQLSGLSALKNSTLDTGTSGNQQVTFGVSGNNTYNIGGLKGADALAIGANTISVGANGQSTAYTGALTGTGGSLTKTGSGKLTLSGTNNYTGATTVSAGTLLLNGANTGGGLISVAAAATLGGTGSSTAPINVTGVLSPGASIESLASGALTMNNGSTFFYEALDNSATGADLMVVNGTLSLTGVTLDLSMANLGGTWASGDKLTLISYTGTAITSGFTGYTDGATYTGGVFGTNQWVFDYNDAAKGFNYGIDAPAPGSGSFVTLTVIPEPDVAMLVGGLGLIALLRRRRA